MVSKPEHIGEGQRTTPAAEALAEARKMLDDAARDAGYASSELSQGRSAAKVNVARAYMELADRLSNGDGRDA